MSDHLTSLVESLDKLPHGLRYAANESHTLVHHGNGGLIPTKERGGGDCVEHTKLTTDPLSMTNQTMIKHPRDTVSRSPTVGTYLFYREGTKCLDRESNTGPQDLQSCALPTELSRLYFSCANNPRLLGYGSANL
eukprot:scaffold73084_cov35-Attheya_sp.AAC.2